MTKEEQIKSFEKIVTAMSETLLAKGDDYANEDRLSNFKNTASILGCTPEDIAMTLIGVKVARLGVLLHGKTPKNEPIDDSILDLANYAILLKMIREDNVE